MTKKDKVKNMFRDENGWKTGIRNGLTLSQILYKLRPLPLPQSQIELREEKNRLRSIVRLVQKDLEKERVPLSFLPFNKKQPRIVFIPETCGEKQQCLDALYRRARRLKDNVQRYRNCMKIYLANYPELGEKDKKMIQGLIDSSYELMD